MYPECPKYYLLNVSLTLSRKDLYTKRQKDISTQQFVLYDQVLKTQHWKVKK